MTLTIRKATIDDAYKIAEILANSWLVAYKDIIPPKDLHKHGGIERRYQIIKTALANPEGEFYIVFDDNIPCGHFMFGPSRDEDLPNFCEIVAFYAVKEFWDKGVGRAMMTFALYSIQSQKYNNVLLWVFKDNERAKKFYEKFGFIPDGTEKAGPFSNGAAEVRYILNLKNQ